jgi:rare lipoprotein A
LRRLAAAAIALAGVSACVRSARPDSAQRGAFIAEGWASYYGAELQGHRTASGELFDSAKLTAAHRSIRFGTCVTVVHLHNQRSVDVLINDRGPFAADRIIDVSQAAAAKLGMIAQGVVRVRLYLCRR